MLLSVGFREGLTANVYVGTRHRGDDLAELRRRRRARLGKTRIWFPNTITVGIDVQARVRKSFSSSSTVSASRIALERAGIGFDDLDVIELNEAFADQVLACLADWGIDPEEPRLNPRASGISLGHPIAATGIRMLVTLAHELPDLDGTLALETMCIGGGQALAAVFERV